MPKYFCKKSQKKYAHNIFHKKTKMRAYQSQVQIWQGFWPGRTALFKNGHFKNVQNRFVKIQFEKNKK
jgi:hypothetical protein